MSSSLFAAAAAARSGSRSSSYSSSSSSSSSSSPERNALRASLRVLGDPYHPLHIALREPEGDVMRRMLENYRNDKSKPLRSRRLSLYHGEKLTLRLFRVLEMFDVVDAGDELEDGDVDTL